MPILCERSTICKSVRSCRFARCIPLSNGRLIAGYPFRVENVHPFPAMDLHWITCHLLFLARDKRSHTWRIGRYLFGEESRQGIATAEEGCRGIYGGICCERRDPAKSETDLTWFSLLQFWDVFKLKTVAHSLHELVFLILCKCEPKTCGIDGLETYIYRSIRAMGSLEKQKIRDTTMLLTTRTIRTTEN